MRRFPGPTTDRWSCSARDGDRHAGRAPRTGAARALVGRSRLERPARTPVAVAKALAKAPPERYETAGAFARDVRQAAGVSSGERRSSPRATDAGSAGSRAWPSPPSPGRSRSRSSSPPATRRMNRASPRPTRAADRRDARSGDRFGRAAPIRAAGGGEGHRRPLGDRGRGRRDVADDPIGAVPPRSLQCPRDRRDRDHPFDRPGVADGTVWVVDGFAGTPTAFDVPGDAEGVTVDQDGVVWVLSVSEA
jgi:hypothetical protein